MPKPRKPNGLGARGAQLWERVTGTYDLDECPEKLAILEHAARTMDDLQKFSSAMKGQPLTVRGSAGQQCINPIQSEIRYARGLLSQLLARLNFQETLEDG